MIPFAAMFAAMLMRDGWQFSFAALIAAWWLWQLVLDGFPDRVLQRMTARFRRCGKNKTGT